MNDSPVVTDQWSASPISTTAAAAPPQPRKGVDKVSFDNVPVDPAFFEHAIYVGCEVKWKFVKGDAPVRDQDKSQDTNTAGVLKWWIRVQAATQETPTRRRRSGEIKVTVAANDDPGSGFEFGDRVELRGLRYGVMPQTRRDGSRDYSIWWSADAVVSVASRAPLKVAASP